MPITADEWQRGATIAALADDIEAQYGEDARTAFLALRERAGTAFTAREVLHEAFDLKPLVVGQMTTQDDGSTKTETISRFDQREEAANRLGTMLDALADDEYIYRKEIQTEDGSETYYRYAE